LVAPSCVGVRDVRSRAGRRQLEVFTPWYRRGISDLVDRVVVVELALRLVRDEAKDADVRVGHDRASGSGNVIEAAIAWGSSSGTSSGPTRRKPSVSLRLVIGWGEPRHSGQAVMYAAAAGVKRRRQRGQQRRVI
jgi:hypothetical protein